MKVDAGVGVDVGGCGFFKKKDKDSLVSDLTLVQSSQTVLQETQDWSNRRHRVFFKILFRGALLWSTRFALLEFK